MSPTPTCCVLAALRFCRPAVIPPDYVSVLFNGLPLSNADPLVETALHACYLVKAVGKPSGVERKIAVSSSVMSAEMSLNSGVLR
jgi:hypothetical protein